MFTPAASIRLASERSPEEFIELVLDDTSDPPAVVGRTTRGRGRRMISSERAVRDGVPVANLTEEDVLTFLLRKSSRLVENRDSGSLSRIAGTRDSWLRIRNPNPRV